MKSFLLNGKRPIIRWGNLPDNTFFEGKIPEGYSLAITPSEGYVVVDVDKHGSEDGFRNIPWNIKQELDKTLHYNTKNKGAHYWLKYTGDKPLGNKTSGLSIDLRTHKGYVVWYPQQDVRHCISAVKDSSKTMNRWLEELFSYV